MTPKSACSIVISKGRPNKARFQIVPLDFGLETQKIHVSRLQIWVLMIFFEAKAYSDARTRRVLGSHPLKTWEHGNMGTWEHGDMGTWGHGNLAKNHEPGNMGTWEHGGPFPGRMLVFGQGSIG
jgi:hypothetical protein